MSTATDGHGTEFKPSRKAAVIPAPTEYYETLGAGVSAWYEHLAARARDLGYEVQPQHEASWEPMYRCQSQHKFYELRKAGAATFTRLLSIYAYRLDSGRYEVMGYLS
jgi:hypothetical protein